MKSTILLVDNNAEDLETWSRVLKNAGMETREAQDPEAARRILEDTVIDLLVIDLRLRDDGDEYDISGLEFAKESAYRRVPKIILTAFDAGYNDIRQVLGPTVDDLPPTVAFVRKDEPSKILVDLIRQTLEVWPRLRAALVKVSEQIRSDHTEARRQAHLNYRVAVGLSVLGGLIVFGGIALAWFNQMAIGLVGIASGIAIQVITHVFLPPVNRANSRMDTYHREMLETYRFDFLLAATYELPFEKRAASMERLVNTAIDAWIGFRRESHGQPMPKKTD